MAKGGVAAFTSGGSWYWRVSKPATDEFHERFWKQLVRWLVVGAKEQLSVSTDAEIYARRDPVTIRATVLGKDMQPLDDATVRGLGGRSGRQHPADSAWTGSSPKKGYTSAALCRTSKGSTRSAWRSKAGKRRRSSGAFLVARPHAELANAGMKEDALQEMAAVTQGKYYDLSTAGQMAEEHSPGQSQRARSPCSDPAR